MKSLIIIGYSGHAYVVISTALANQYSIYGYCDIEKHTSNPHNIQFLGSEVSYFDSFRSQEFFVAVGDNTIRMQIGTALRLKARPARALVHPSAIISPNTSIGELSLVCAGATIQPFVTIEQGVIVNTTASVDHDCSISAFSHIGPNATLTGNVSIGTGALIGAGAVVLPGLTVGAGSTLGAGAVLTTNLPPGEVWVGNPARPLSTAHT